MSTQDTRTIQRIFWIGDSTVHENRIDTWPQCGMGQGLSLYLQPGIAVCIRGVNGRSTKSYREEGLWDAVKHELTQGDLLLIQFGHNDEKLEDPTRYTTTEEYARNLLSYAREAREKGALPVLVTPLTRRVFNPNGTLRRTHAGYPEAARVLASREGLPLVDLTESSRALVEKMGDVPSRALYMHIPAGYYPHRPQGLVDNTHLQYLGAVRFAGLVAQGLRALGAPYSQVLLPPRDVFPHESEYTPGS